MRKIMWLAIVLMLVGMGRTAFARVVQEPIQIEPYDEKKLKQVEAGINSVTSPMEKMQKAIVALELAIASMEQGLRQRQQIQEDI